MRLTFLYSSVLALTMVLFGAFVYLFMVHNLTRELDRALANTAREVLQSIKVSGDYPLPLKLISLPDVDVFSSPDTYLQVVDKRGAIAAHSSNLGRQTLPLSEDTLRRAANGDDFYETVFSGRQALRVYNHPLIVQGDVLGVLQVGKTMGSLKSALERLRLLLLFGGGLTLVLAGTLGWAMAGAALKPIDRITETASSIQEALDLSRRIEYRGPQDEVGRLASTLNGMLERLQSAYRKLEEAGAEQRRFVADASHELRTPLTTIRGNVELLQRMGDADPATRAEALADIAGEAERMSRLIADLLALARADAGLKLKKDGVSLYSLLTGISRRGAVLAGGVAFRAGDFTPLREAMVVGDADYLKQLLLILMDNAFKYTPPGGEVRLEARSGGQYVEISVCDNGAGIAESDLPHIFKRFYRADVARAGSGTGLGLAIARWIAEEHGGSIEVQSRLGEGSVFTVRLPLAAQGYRADE
ncbi:MAG: sensor histidine kinase [Firmicutes bacterium]|nr:sensor histidine kinase [Bacillota bacterium]